MDIDELVLLVVSVGTTPCFSSLLDIDELVPFFFCPQPFICFSSLLDIDELVLSIGLINLDRVLVLCWILMNLYSLIGITGSQHSFSSLLDIDELVRAHY